MGISGFKNLIVKKISELHEQIIWLAKTIERLEQRVTVLEKANDDSE